MLVMYVASLPLLYFTTYCHVSCAPGLPSPDTRFYIFPNLWESLTFNLDGLVKVFLLIHKTPVTRMKTGFMSFNQTCMKFR